VTVRSDALAIARASIRAVDPRRAVLRSLRRSGSGLLVENRRVPLAFGERVHVVAVGKAASAMADAAASRLGPLVAEGLVVHRRGDPPPQCGWPEIFGAHPVPNADSRHAGERVERFVTSRPSGAFLLFLLSGGGSAILEAPAAGVRMADIAATARQLLASGAPIQAMNTLRRHLSRVKGGWLRVRAAPRPSATLAISDVVGDTPWDIASGPTVPDPTTFRDAVRAARRWAVWDRLPTGVRAYLHAGLSGQRPETPKPGDPAFRGGSFHLVATNRIALKAAERAARHRGYRAILLSRTVVGETAPVARRQAAVLRRVADEGRPWRRPAALLSGGETTVTLGASNGTGGRNQEFALACATGLRGLPAVCALSLGTDGIDGPTDAAGGIVTGETVDAARRAGVNLARALADHNAYPALVRLGGLVRTGPTGTNVMDLHVLLAGSVPQSRSRYGKK
jgi:glycerate 2-kinase